ncbi:MAG: hypothetical protein A2X36_02775 [Elusimicrobia bacterium GWA2_69_24]|nr:MAG: hypothetical protein A2X36_02775 [Elusimicrobia bacterium GWA2_69_24]
MKAGPDIAGKRIALYTSSQGNYFFLEIRDLFAAALKELGLRVELRDERRGFSASARGHVVIAPHEFFYRGRGVQLRRQALPAPLALYCTEQMDSQWFRLGESLFRKADMVWEVDRQVAAQIAADGVRCRHVPLGYARCALFRSAGRLPAGYGTAALDPALLRRRPWGEPLARRPIDLFFAGNLTERRRRFFAAAAPSFARHEAYFHFTDPRLPVLPGDPGSLDTRLTMGLVQRSKIVLNIHRAQSTYFEWQRVLVHGIGQKALVVSEPCSDCSPLRPGRDFVEAPMEDIPELVEYHLRSPRGKGEAQRIAEQGFKTLTQDCRLADLLRPAVSELLALGRKPARGGRPPQPRSRVSARSALQPVETELLARGGRGGTPPRVTVAVTLHDYRRFIIPCLESVRTQTLRRLDLVVVDDASSDGSPELVRDWMRRHGRRFRDCRLIRHRRNQGLARARNTGFENARTPFVFVLDADNQLYPRCLERLARALEHSGADFAFSYHRCIGEAENLLNIRPWNPAAFRDGNYLDAMALLRKTSWELLGGYRAHDVQGWEDYDFWLRLAEIDGWGVRVPEVLAAYRVHLRSMIHRETNPNARRLERYFKGAFSVRSGNGNGDLRELAFAQFSRRRAAPGAGGASPDGKDRYLKSARSMLHDLTRDLRP